MSHLASLHSPVRQSIAPSKAARHQRPRGRKLQLGVFMAELSLALALTALAGIGTLRALALSQRLQAVDIEADKVNQYRSALQSYVDENYTQLQYNTAITRNSVTVPPGTGLGQIMNPTTAQLQTMGYLSTGFDDSTSLADGAHYANQIRLYPAACATLHCDVLGMAYIDKPILKRGSSTETDGTAIGEMIYRIGGQAGTSIEGISTNITGAGAGWGGPTDPVYANPVAGQPAGVFAARFGFAASSLSAYVRINDTRDPNLQGNLSAVGNLVIGGTASFGGAVSFGGGVTSNGPLTVNGTSTLNGDTVVQNAGVTCITLDKTGIVTIGCNGQLNAKTGTFTDGLGNTSTIGPTGVTATGGFTAGGNKLFDAADPNAITVFAGQQFFKGVNGTLTLMTLDNGDVVAGRNVAGQRLALQTSAIVTPNTACANTSGAVTGAASEYAPTANGGLAVCAGGVWRGLSNVATANDACPVEGTLATDTTDGGGLICKRNFYVPVHSAISNFVMGTPFQITQAMLNVPQAKTNFITCDSLGAGSGSPLVYILPQNETSSNSAFSRAAVDSNPGDNSGTWTFVMKDGTNPGPQDLTNVTAIGMPFCYY